MMLKKTISLTVMLQPSSGVYNLDVHAVEWNDDGKITDFTRISQEDFETMDEALMKATHINYEYEKEALDVEPVG